MKNTCSYCHHVNRAGTLICDQCGQPLATTMMRSPFVSQPPPAFKGIIRFDQRRGILKFQSGSAPVVSLEARQRAGVTVGRFDPTSTVAPDIDLRPADGMVLGVSRQHARLTFYNDALHITDLGSTNGTMVNGRRLRSYQPMPLQHGDEIQLGSLVLLLSFARTDELPRA